jgi:type VI protein secretion system component VasF
MFDIHQMKGKQFRRLSKQEQARVKARDLRSGIAQFSFVLIVIVGAALYVGFGWTFLD